MSGSLLQLLRPYHMLEIILNSLHVLNHSIINHGDILTSILNILTSHMLDNYTEVWLLGHLILQRTFHTVPTTVLIIIHISK